MRLKAFEGDISETICLEVTISKIVWLINYVYQPPYNNNKGIIYSELSNILSDLNIDNSIKKKDDGDYLSDLCDKFSLKNLITDITCVKSTNGTSINVLLKNKSRCFYHTATFETGLRDCYKLALIFFKTSFKKLQPKVIEYRNYKNFK